MARVNESVKPMKATVIPRLELRALSKAYRKADGQTQILEDINIEVQSGEFVSILGASGCGKTTLLRIIDGLEMPTSGHVLVNGKVVDRPGPDRGFVFQQDRLMPWRTLWKNASIGLEFRGVPRRQAKEEAQKYLELVGLGGFDNHYPHELSGGMRQRANLARAFCVHPEMLLMDEPFASLDAQTREIMQLELLRIWKGAQGRTVVFITHQIDEAIFLSDRIIVLTARPGRVKEIINVDFNRPRDLGIKRTPEFISLIDHIWRLIEQEVKGSLNLEALARVGK
jgi:NitT/TauT family transport system ATP-binding protein